MNELPQVYPVTAHTDHVGPGSTFVVINGSAQDGAVYIPQALDRGARTLVVQEGVPLDAASMSAIAAHHANLLRVPDTRLALAQLSAQAWGHPAQRLTIIGVTGTKGKTTSVFLLRHILARAGYRVAMISGVHNMIHDMIFPAILTTPTPDYLQMFLAQAVAAGVTHVVMEVSAQALTLHRVVDIMFAGVIFTNLSLEHLEFYDSIDDYFAAKRLIFKQLKPGGLSVINGANSWGKRLLTMGDGVDFAQFKVTQAGAAGIRGDIDYNGVPLALHVPALMGEFNAQNIAGVCTLAAGLGICAADVAHALATFTGVPGRMEQYRLRTGAVAVVDYAHNPSSFESVLPTLKSHARRLIVVFGAGGQRDPGRRPLMGAIAAQVADLIVLTSDNPRTEDAAAICRDILAGIALGDHRKVHIELDRSHAIAYACAHAQEGDIVAVLGKGPDEYQQIGLTKTFFSDRREVARYC